MGTPMQSSEGVRHLTGASLQPAEWRLLAKTLRCRAATDQRVMISDLMAYVLADVADRLAADAEEGAP